MCKKIRENGLAPSDQPMKRHEAFQIARRANDARNADLRASIEIEVVSL